MKSLALLAVLVWRDADKLDAVVQEINLRIEENLHYESLVRAEVQKAEQLEQKVCVINSVGPISPRNWRKM